jgi:hypothetical protein
MSFSTKHPALGLLVLFTFAISSAAAPLLTFQGTGSDSAVSFQFVSAVPLSTSGLLTTFGFNYCNAPATESCDQVNYSAVSGVVRWLGVGTSTDTRTFEFDSYINNGVYPTLAVGSPNSGTLTITGSTDATTEPSNVGLAALGVFLLLARRGMSRRGSVG